MNTLVIDSTPSVIRWGFETPGGKPESHRSHQTVGHRHQSSDGWVWTKGDQHLSAFSDEIVSLDQLWEQVLSTDHVPELLEPARTLIGSAKSVIVSPLRLDRLVYLIPESLSEAAQNVLIGELSNQFGVPQRDNIYLLWRPVALALSAIDKVGDSDVLLVADFAHAFGGIRELGVGKHCGVSCPVRDFLKKRINGRTLTESFNDWLSRNYRTGPVSSDDLEDNSAVGIAKHLSADLNFDPPQAWIRDGLSFKPLKVSHDDWSRPVDFEHSVSSIRPFIESKQSSGNVASVWHGWPVYWQGEEVVQRNFPHAVLGDPDSAVAGGVEFARRHRKDLPTYFEVLPGYDIWCRTSELGMPRRFQWEPLIRKRVVDGTMTVKDDLIDRFRLNPGTLNFSLNVRIGESRKYRFIKTELPRKIDSAARILIRSQIRPTGGGVRIALAPPRDEPDLFGRNAQVALKWDQAEERNVSDLTGQVDHYSYPFIIQSEGDPASRLLLEDIGENIRNGANITDHLKPLAESLVPGRQANAANGIAFGGRRVASGLSQNVRALVDELNRFAYSKLVEPVNAPDWEWTRLVSCLFFYADEDNQNAVFERVMEAQYRPIEQAFFAFGRTCRKADHLKRFLHRVLDDWDELNRAPWVLFWPFQKCLGYYGDPVQIPSELVESVMARAIEVLDRIIAGERPAGFFGRHLKKWTLSAVLFGLRRREIDSAFMDLESGDSLAKKMKARLRDQKIRQTPIPEIALAGIEIPSDPPSLPELILRFLEARADETDIAIAGGIGLIS